MRLSDVVNQFRRKASEGTNFVRNPAQVVWQKVRKRGQILYENTALADQKDTQKSQDKRPDIKPNEASLVSSEQYQSNFLHTSANQNDAITAAHNNSFENSLDSQTRSLGDRPEVQNFYPLPLNKKLKGTWGSHYCLTKNLQQNSWRYLYEGNQEYSDEILWIYAYKLSRENFSPSEIGERQKSFEQLMSVNSKLGHDRDFRILKIEDIFVDYQQKNCDYCYLIAKAIPNAYTLSEYLQHNSGSIAPLQIKQILQQVLQSLKYLHYAYRVYWSNDDSEQGMCHGNLNLDSLWLRVITQNKLNSTPQFFVYLTNFALWEHLFSPNINQIATSSEDLGNKKNDLKDLGWVTFSLLTGYCIDPKDPPDNIDPQDTEHWSRQTNIFKPYVLRLLGRGSEPSFKTIGEAEIELKKLDLNTQVIRDNPQTNSTTDEIVTEKQNLSVGNAKKFHFLIACFLALGGVLFFVFWLLDNWLKPSPSPIFCPVGECTLRDINDVFVLKGQKIRYAVETSSSWNQVINSSLSVTFEDVLEKKVLGLNLVREFPRVKVPKTLNELIKDEDFQDFSPKVPNLKIERIIQELQAKNLDFALVQLTSKQSELWLEDFDFEVVGFDAIAILVAFSDANRDQNIPNRLNGEITLSQLRKIFVGKSINSSNEIQFEPLVMSVDKKGDNLNISRDKSIAMDSVVEDFKQLAFLPSIEMSNQVDNIYEHLLTNFELEDTPSYIIGIGFDRLSNVFSQCSVYPLAIRSGNVVSSLIVESDGHAITPYTDLCYDRGSYWANSDSFPVNDKQRLDRDNAYPLATELAVVYPKCPVDEVQSEKPCNAGQAFAQMLKTVEGQYLLSEMNLVPIRSMEEIRQLIWSPSSTN